MHFVLWDTRHGGAYKDFAGGYGVGQFRGQGFRAKLIERFYRRDYRSVSLVYGYLAAILRRLGHTAEYSLDETPTADVYVFNPALMTVPHEVSVIRRINQTQPQARVLVCGTAAGSLSEEFSELNCQVLLGEPEQLLSQLDQVLASRDRLIPIGTVARLDDLPFPDWSLFPYRNFRVNYDFWKFPTAYIQSSRGCTLSCSYCPYIILENKVRTRSPEIVAEEMARGIREYGFQSFKFRDPLFGAKRKHALEIAERIGKLPRKIQFSVESRIELLPRELLETLRDVGLTSVTVGIETPSRDTLLKYKRAPIKDDKQSHFVEMCRILGIRVIAGFMIGFPEDTRETMRSVLRYAKEVNPFGGNFNICTPYPGTGFYGEIERLVATRDWSRYDVYTPNLKYEHLTADDVTAMHQKCFTQYYFRWKYLRENWRFMLPRLHASLSAMGLIGPRQAGTRDEQTSAVAGTISASDNPRTLPIVMLETAKNEQQTMSAHRDCSDSAAA